MKKLRYLVLTSPLFLAMTCHNLAYKMAKSIEVSTEISDSHLQTVVRFDEQYLSKKRVDSVLFSFSDQFGDPISSSRKNIERKSTSTLTEIKDQISLSNLNLPDTLEVYVTFRLYKRARYLESVNLNIAMYDLTKNQ
ncbi:hypothetical protein [Roseivirga sp.]|uniref:hypothetical protein n=1 Tax=Roseivirga sp. TaxID=1964215 RepID=UPI003B5239FD